MTTLETRPIRTKPTWVAYLQMGAYGAFVYALGASQILLRDEQQTSRTVAGLHGSAWALGLVIMSLFSASITLRIGRGRAMRVGSIVMVLGILGYTSGLPVFVTIASVVIAGLGGALMVTGLSAFLSSQQKAAAPAAISEANALGAIAGLLGAVGVGVGVSLTLGWRPALWVLMASLLLLEIWRGRSLRIYDVGEEARIDTPDAPRLREIPKIFWWSLLVMLPAAGIEYCLALWSADLLREQGGFGSAAASTSLGVVVAGLIIGRIAGSKLAERFNPETLIIVAFGISAVAFMVVWATAIPWLMLVFLFITGCGVALHWPLAIARTMRSAPGFVDRASGLGLFAAGIGVMIAPFALGALADGFGLRMAFLIVPVLSILGVVLVWARPVR
jgi:predicted MFS family arabinose efflux permease